MRCVLVCMLVLASPGNAKTQGIQAGASATPTIVHPTEDYRDSAQTIKIRSTLETHYQQTIMIDSIKVIRGDSILWRRVKALMIHLD